MANISDYSKSFTDIHDLLPTVYKSDVNKALAENVFNRFLTKTELKEVDGVIGTSSAPNRLPEPSIHRQTYQLQPLIHNKIATVDHLKSFKDIMRESARVGVNLARFDEWGDALQFNFVPPVDIDKIINYANYYWLGAGTPTYITIKNRLWLVSNIILQGYSDNPGLETLSEQYMVALTGLTRDSLIDQIEALYPGFVALIDEKVELILTNPFTNSWDTTEFDLIDGGLDIINTTTTSLTLPGNHTTSLLVTTSFPFELVGSINAGAYQVLTATYDANTNTTEVFVLGATLSITSAEGIFAVGEYDINFGTSQEVGTQTHWNSWNVVNTWSHISDIPEGVNISTLAPATMPIIEYDSTIQLNSWSYTKHNWAYRKTPSDSFLSVVDVPTDAEVFSNYDQRFSVVDFPSTTSITVDLASNPSTVMDVGSDITIDYTSLGIVKYYKILNIVPTGDQRLLTLDSSIPVGASNVDTVVYNIRYSSQGDDWTGFFSHWAYMGVNSHIPVSPQIVNPTIISTSPTFQSETQLIPVSNYTQDWYNTLPLTFSPNTEDIRVYVNGVRQYGSYVEGYYDGSDYFVDIPLGQQGNAIKFFNPPGYGSLAVDVGPAAESDARRVGVEVRTNTDSIAITEPVSLIEYRLTEQQRTEQHQYPLFDVFNLDGTTANSVSPIWTFQELPTSGINSIIGRRVASSGTVFNFEQFLIDEEDGRMYAYMELNADGNQLQTIWKKGTNDERYTPRYVNTSREDVPIGDPLGDWTIPDQMFYNLEHENKKVLSTTELLQHFKSIISNQPNPTGFGGDGTNVWRVTNIPNYGLGGTIKEYNDGFDTFLSSVFINELTVVGLIDFANRRYDQHLNALRSYFIGGCASFISSVEPTFIADLQLSLSEHIINQFENDSSRDLIFGDSTTYNNDTNLGVRNWCATLPYVRLMYAVQPKLLYDNSINLIELYHHDGHISYPTISAVELDNIIAAVERSSISSRGSLAALPAILGSNIGDIYYATDVRELYKLNLVGIGPIQPTGYGDGTYWFNTNESILYVMTGGVFLISPDQSGAWTLINVDVMYAELLLYIENKLYENAPTGPLNYDIFSVQSDVDYPVNEKKQFTKFVKEFQIANPTASTYDASNPFTWNYSTVDPTTYDIELGAPSEWGGVSPSSWYDIYVDIYGTRYPQIEPWVLQQYSSKPDWWDVEYAGTTRTWSQQMWFNIAAAEIPVGNEYPTGAISTGVFGDAGWVNSQGVDIGGLKRYAALSVNVTDTPSVEGGYQPDQLLPPYYTSLDPADNIIIQFGSLITTIVPFQQASAEFPFGTNGPIEDSWRRSSMFLYDLAEISYLTQPVRFMRYTLGDTLGTIGGLTIDTSTNKVPSHRDITFHGDIVSGVPVSYEGINQWFSHYNRFNSFDIYTSDFRSNWVDWRPRLAYQMASMIIEDTLMLASDQQILDALDTTILVKHTLGLDDAYIDSLNVVVNKVGINTISNGIRVPVGVGEDWKFRITTPNPSSQSIMIHGVNTAESPTQFNILDSVNTGEVFFHYPIDETVTIEFNPGDVIDLLGSNYEGVQGLVNFVDGYASYLKSTGFVFSIEKPIIDPIYSRTINWQFETERMVDAVYIGMVSDELPIQFVGPWNYVYSNSIADTFTATSNKALSLVDGDVVQIVTTGRLPVPFTDEEIYYVVNSVAPTFQLSNTLGGTPIDIATSGQGIQVIGMHKTVTATPIAFHEVNPFRNVVVYNNVIGIVSDIHKGPFTDIVNEQGIYDQYGRSISVNNTRVFRGDTETSVTVLDGITNDVVGDTDFRNFIHIGGMHLFVDGFEHCILFNDSTIENSLMFSEFLGTAIDHMALSVKKQTNVTYRPNVGGHFLLNDKLLTNMEASIEKHQLMYDTHLADETSDLTRSARRLVAFESKDYFNEMGVTLKSQLLFYRGATQYKGSTTAVKAFINSTNFVDATIDEYWAYKVGTFGDNRLRQFPEIVLTDRDSRFDKLSFHFTTPNDAIQANFIEITFDDAARWANQPDQMDDIFQNSPNLFFEAEVTEDVQFTSAYINANQYVTLPVICDSVNVVAVLPTTVGRYISTGTFHTVTGLTNYIANTNSLKVFINGEPHTQFMEDGNNTITIIFININDVIDVVTGNSTLVDGIHYTRVNSGIIFFDNTSTIYDTSMPEEYHFFCLNPAKSKLNPVKLIDFVAGVNVKNIGVWDPAKGHHYHNAVHVITVQSPTDPAFYTNSSNIGRIDRNLAWDATNVGDTWWDQEMLNYVHYYDDVIIPNTQDRISAWGDLAEYSGVYVYEWTESTISPDLYDDDIFARQQSGENISGTVKHGYAKRDRTVGTGLFDGAWIDMVDEVLHYYIALETTSVDVSASTIEDGEDVSIYKNGELDSTLVVSGGTVIIPTSFTNADKMTVVRLAYIPTIDDLKFDPIVNDDNITSTQYEKTFQYTEVTTITASGIDVSSKYYFWVRNTATNHGGLTISNVELQLSQNPEPYVIFQNLLDPEVVVANDSSTTLLPARYTQSIFRGLVQQISSNDRYKLRFVKDFTLRNNIEDYSSSTNLKNQYAEWNMVRERQTVNVPRVLWNKLIETVTGVNLTDAAQSVPSLDRVLYDASFGTSYRFGLREGQAMVSRQVAIDTILSVLTDPIIDLYPINREEFLAANTFDTPDNIYDTMQLIYNRFLPELVNKIWFAVLYEGLASNVEYTDIFKTSWIQLDGIRLLETLGASS